MSLPELPACVDRDDAEQIVRFVVARAGLLSKNRVLVREIAEICDFRPDVLSRFMREGRFTMRAAMMVEAGLGRDFIQWEWLVNPVECVRNGSLI